jgi:hypothetical protein
MCLPDFVGFWQALNQNPRKNVPFWAGLNLHYPPKLKGSAAQANR